MLNAAVQARYGLLIYLPDMHIVMLCTLAERLARATESNVPRKNHVALEASLLMPKNAHGDHSTCKVRTSAHLLYGNTQ